jgi:hypothetical protein
MPCEILAAVSSNLLLSFFLMLGFNAMELVAGSATAIRPKGMHDKMSEFDETIVPHAPATREANDERFEFAFALPRRNKRVMLKFPIGLLASSDGEVRRKIAEILRQCGLPSVLASTVAESGIALAGHEVSIVLCNGCLADGNYEDIVKLVACLTQKLQ